MTDIELTAKSDRELLIMVIDKLNTICYKVEKHDKDLYNNGWGILTQTKMLWMLAGGILSIVVLLIKGALAKI